VAANLRGGHTVDCSTTGSWGGVGLRQGKGLAGNACLKRTSQGGKIRRTVQPKLTSRLPERDAWDEKIDKRGNGGNRKCIGKGGGRGDERGKENKLLGGELHLGMPEKAMTGVKPKEVSLWAQGRGFKGWFRLPRMASATGGFQKFQVNV